MFAVRFRGIVLTVLAVFACQSWAIAESSTGVVGREAGIVVTHSQLLKLEAGQSAEISARITRPSNLPDNARVRVSIVAVRAAENAKENREAVLSKVLHALDGDFFTVVTAKTTANYRIEFAPEEDEITLFEGNRWRETGYVDELIAAPRQVKWKHSQTVGVSVSVRRIANSMVSLPLTICIQPCGTTDTEASGPHVRVGGMATSVSHWLQFSENAENCRDRSASAQSSHVSPAGSSERSWTRLLGVEHSRTTLVFDSGLCADARA